MTKPEPTRTTPERQRTDHDCLRCCIATIFGLPYEDVPLFGGTEYHDAKGAASAGWAQTRDIEAWLAQRGLGMAQLPDVSVLSEERRKRGVRLPWGICIASGKSPRGDWDHAVVVEAIPMRGSAIEGEARFTRLVHDPHPSGAGLAGEPHTYWCFTLLDPRAAETAAAARAFDEAADALDGAAWPTPGRFADWLRARADENEAKGEQDG